MSLKEIKNNSTIFPFRFANKALEQEVLSVHMALRENSSQRKPCSPSNKNNTRNVEEEEALLQEMCNLWVEDGRVNVKKKNRDLGNVKWDMCVLGKVFTEKYVHFQGLLNYLKMKWHPKHDLDMKKSESGMYIFHFTISWIYKGP